MMFVIKLLVFISCYNKIYASDSLNNIFESKDYIILLRYSSVYSSYKLNLEKIIEDKSKKKILIPSSELDKIKAFNVKTSQLLDEIHNNYKDNITHSQIYQIKFEITSLDNTIEKIMSFYKKTGRYDYNDILRLEKAIYRMEIYLKGLSNRISDL